MKTYIVPIDFSETSAHAAEFAALLSHQTQVEHIVLLHSYHVSVYESVLPTPDMLIPSEQEIDEQIAEKTRQLRIIRDKIHTEAKKGVIIHVRISRSPLVRAIIEAIPKENADLVILGSNGTNSDHKRHVGSNMVNISHLSPVPVIVVPPRCCYEPIRRVVMACDFSKIKDAIPLQPLKNLLSRYNADLLVVDTDKQARQKNSDPEQLAKETILYHTLEEFNPQYDYNNEGELIDGILSFAKEHDAHLVIALPHKYSFFQSLLHNSVSHELSVHSEVPVLLLK
jgi:nucleotide-binding universal stress UspA family protein